MDTVSRRVSSVEIVGRADELAVGDATLRRLLDGGSDGSAQVLLIAGEAGIGKTRLLDELLRRAGDAGAVTVCGRCVEHGGEIRPLTAVADILAELGAVEESDASIVTPAEALARLFDQARTSLRAASTHGPVVVAVEDLHWSDRTTRGLLTELARARGLGRVLLIGTYRSDELHRRHPLLPLLADLEHAARPERIDLEPLGESDVVELAAAILDQSISEEQGRELARRSGGNPFYAEELLAVDDAERVPAGVHHVILARSRGLEPDALASLQAASVLALPIDPTVLEATAGLETDRYRPAVDTLCRERFLIEDEGGFRFRHELVREVFLDGLLPGERASLFARAAQALEYHRPERLGEIARLHLNAAQLPEALHASVQAAAAASAIGASAEASEHYGRAIDLWDRVDDPTDRTGISHLRLLRSAAEAADLARDFDVAVELARRAIDEAVAVGDPFEEGGALFELSRYLWDASAPGMTEAIERAMAVLPREPLTVERILLEVRSAMRQAFAGEQAAADRALEAAAEGAAELGERGVETTARAHVGYRASHPRRRAGPWQPLRRAPRGAVDRRRLGRRLDLHQPLQHPHPPGSVPGGSRAVRRGGGVRRAPRCRRHPRHRVRGQRAHRPGGAGTVGGGRRGDAQHRATAQSRDHASLGVGVLRVDPDPDLSRPLRRGGVELPASSRDVADRLLRR